MKFTLTYDGALPASANKGKREDVWRIRKELHPQFIDLWHSHPALAAYLGPNGNFPLDGAVLTQGHHMHPGPLRDPYVQRALGPGETARGTVDLNAPILKHGRKFRPLVRETYAAHCGLKITFLRKEGPGKVYQGGDIDGRIKTLLDALTMPQHMEQVLDDPDAPGCIHCLLDFVLSFLLIVDRIKPPFGDYYRNFCKASRHRCVKAMIAVINGIFIRVIALRPHSDWRDTVSLRDALKNRSQSSKAEAAKIQINTRAAMDWLYQFNRDNGNGDFWILLVCPMLISSGVGAK